MVFNLRAQVSDLAGRRLAVYRSELKLTNSEALDKILSSLPLPNYETENKIEGE